MKNSVRILLILLSGIIFNMPLYAQNHAKKKVAVYMTGTTSDAAYKKVIGAKLVNAITESGEYAAVERTADFLAALSAESDYQTSGEVRDSQIARLGQKFGVRYVVVADASELFDEYFIEARLINVETGLVERAFDVNGPADSMQQLIKLAKEVAKGLFSIGISDLNKEPIHLSLFVKNSDGEGYFVTSNQWTRLQNKDNLNKNGICIIDEDKVYIIGMYVTGYSILNWEPNIRSHAPSLERLKLIYKYKQELNAALAYYGGDEVNGIYWLPGFDYYNPVNKPGLSWIGTKPNYDYFPNCFDMQNGGTGFPDIILGDQKAYIRSIELYKNN